MNPFFTFARKRDKKKRQNRDAAFRILRCWRVWPLLVAAASVFIILDCLLEQVCRNR